jgi:hypothetical protein
MSKAGPAFETLQETLIELGGAAGAEVSRDAIKTHLEEARRSFRIPSVFSSVVKLSLP